LVPAFDADTGSFVTADGYVSLDTRALFDYQFQGTNQKRDEYAGYLDGTFDFGNNWRLTGGIRYSYDEKDFYRFVDGGGPCNQYSDPRDTVIVDGECRDSRSQYTSRAGILPRAFDGWNIPLPPEAFGTRVDTKDDWDEVTYRAILDHTFSNGSLAYLSYSTGFLSGGFSETCATVSRCAYDAETNKNFELGWKADLLDSTLRFNAAVFYTEYDDLQRAVVANYIAADGTSQQETVTVNTGSSEAFGVDVDINWIANENTEFKLALNWLDHDYTSGILPALRTTDVPTPLEQFKVPYSPKFKGMLMANYAVPMSSGARVLLSGSVNYQSKAETDVFNAPNTIMDERTLVYLSIGYLDPEDRFTLTVYMDNVTDEEYRIAALPVAGLWNFTNYGPPRSYGIRLGVRF